MPSFDIVSTIDHQEIKNAIEQTLKEIRGRFDFKGVKATIEKTEDGILVVTEDEFKFKQVKAVLDEKLVRRQVPLKAVQFGKIELGSGKTIRCLAEIQEGIPQEKAKDVVKFIKKLGIKVQSQIMGDQVRVTGKKRDDLQATIAKLKEEDFGIHMKYTNFRD
jgi:hypothetical protein